MKKFFFVLIAVSLTLLECGMYGDLFNAGSKTEQQSYKNNVYKPKSKNELIALLKNVNIPLENIDVSEVRDFSHLFDSTYGRKDFKGLEKWDPKNAKKMHFMFADKNMMFYLFSENGFKSFPKWYMDFVKKHPTFSPKSKKELLNILKDEKGITLAEIDVSDIDDLSNIFSKNTYARDYLAGLENWDVSKVENFEGLFFEYKLKYGEKRVVSDISGWKPQNAKNMKNAFFMSSIKYPDWYIDFVKKNPTYTPKNKAELIAIIDGDYDNASHNRQISISLIEIDISKIDDLSYVFCFSANTEGCRVIDKWTRRTLYDFVGIEYWDVSNVKNMERMFMGSKFDRDISKWDVSNVINFYETFARTPFNQDISSWKINKNAKIEKMFFDSTLEKEEKLPSWAE